MMNTDSDAVTGVVMADDTAANEVVHHYKRYYRLLLRLHDSTMNADDSTEVITLANMCPFVDGSVVYNARALYSYIYQDPRMFSDIGCEPEDRSSIAESRTSKIDSTVNSGVIGDQSYILYPNPSNGYITIQQKVGDNNPVQAEVLNVTGMSVYKGLLHFENGITSLSMYNKVPGLYLLQLTDTKGNQFMLKFVIE